MFENGSKRPPTFEWWHCWKQAEISAVFLQLAMVVWKWQKTDHQPFSGDFVGKRQKFRPFSNNHNQLFENGRKQTINNSVGTLLEKTTKILAVFQQLGFGHFPTTQNVSVVFQQTGFGRFPTIFFGRFPHPQGHLKHGHPSIGFELAFLPSVNLDRFRILAVSVQSLALVNTISILGHLLNLERREKFHGGVQLMACL